MPPLRQALLDPARVQHLLAGSYSANAYAYGLQYQNCNQWVVELLAAAWGELPDGADLRARAQTWLRTAPYAPEPVTIPSRWLMLGAIFVPLVHLSDHPQEAVDTHAAAGQPAIDPGNPDPPAPAGQRTRGNVP